MKKTSFQKTLGRESKVIRTYYNKTGRRDKDGKPIFETLQLLDFTGKLTY